MRLKLPFFSSLYSVSWYRSDLIRLFFRQSVITTTPLSNGIKYPFENRSFKSSLEQFANTTIFWAMLQIHHHLPACLNESITLVYWQAFLKICRYPLPIVKTSFAVPRLCLPTTGTAPETQRKCPVPLFIGNFRFTVLGSKCSHRAKLRNGDDLPPWERLKDS